MTQEGGFLKASDWKVIAAMFIGFGVVLRLIPYLHNRSLWMDEAMLAKGILLKPFSQLLGLLDYRQMAPVGFLFIEKSWILNFGESEYVLRLFPLLAGILSLFLFYGVARRILTLRGATIALGLFAISEPLLYYSSELKPYSSDVAIALGIYLLGLVCIEKESRFIPSLFLLSIAGAILIWFSYPAVFSLAGVGIALTLYCLKTQKWQHVAWLSLPAAFWLGSFALNYFTTLVLSQTPRMVKDWIENNGFMPMPPVSVEDLMWYPTAFFFMFREPGGLSFHGLAAFCFVIGWVLTFSEKRYACYMLTLPFLFTLLASGLHKYPFQGRLLLFLVPAMMIFIGAGVDRIMTLARPTGRIVSVSLCVLLFLVPVQKAIANLLNPARMDREEIRPVMTYLSQHYQKGDRLYLHHPSEPAFGYYAKRLGFEDIPYQRGVRSEQNWNKYVDELKGLRGNDRVWILFSHVVKNSGVDEEKFFVHVLDGMGQQIDSFKRKDASVYLYELRSDATQ
jgi:uncharacterized membrane protein